MRSRHLYRKIAPCLRPLALAVPALLAAAPACAYVGPGAGMGTLGGILAVLGAIAVALLGILLFPVHLAIKAYRRHAAAQTPNEPTSPANPE